MTETSQREPNAKLRYQRNNREKIRALQKAWRDKNREHVREYARTYQRFHGAQPELKEEESIFEGFP